MRPTQIVDSMTGEVVQYDGGALNIEEMKSRQIAQMQALIYNAIRRPRDEAKAIANIQRACERKGFAKLAKYSFPRGKGNKMKMIEGPTINFAKEIAKYYQNVKSGFTVLFDDGARVLIEGFAWDMENNVFHSLTDEFRVTHQRKQADGTTEWVIPNERDKRELIFRRASILIRNCLLAIVPRDMIEDALIWCEQTMKNPDKKELGERINDAIRLFHELGVNVEMLSNWISERREVKNVNFKDATSTEVGDLISIYNAIKDGQITVGDVFFLRRDSEPSSGPAPSRGIDPEKVSPKGDDKVTRPSDDQTDDQTDDQKTEPPDAAECDEIKSLCREVSRAYGGVKQMTGNLKPLRDRIAAWREKARGMNLTRDEYNAAKAELELQIREAKETKTDPGQDDESKGDGQEQDSGTGQGQNMGGADGGDDEIARRAKCEPFIVKVKENAKAMADTEIARVIAQLVDPSESNEYYHKRLNIDALESVCANIRALMDERKIPV